MGFLDRFRRTPVITPPNTVASRQNASVGVLTDNPQQDFYQAFNSRNITAQGCLKAYNYDQILQHKEENIRSLCQLSDYYIDADEIYRGIIQHVYVPYACSSPWVLMEASQKTCDLYNKAYQEIKLQDKLQSIMLQYFKYGNVYVYYMNGNIFTLPFNRCKIGSLSFNGNPIVYYDCSSIYEAWRHNGYIAKMNWINENDLSVHFKGYPPEVVEALNGCHAYAQLNPDNCFVLQGPKEDWQRYSIPMIAACLKPLARKALIQNYEQAILNLASRGIIHVKYGDPKAGQDMLPDRNQLQQIRDVFKQSMSGFPLAVTNHLAEASVVQVDTSDLYQWDKYKQVNNAILGAGGISGILVNGVAEDGSTFASAQVSMETAAARIEAARKDFCGFMNRINGRLLKDMKLLRRNNLKEVPVFAFMPLSMEGTKALRQKCETLWSNGLLSDKTLLQANGYSYERQLKLRKDQINSGVVDILMPRQKNTSQSGDQSSNNTDNDNESGAGRKQLDNDQRTSDPQAAQRGKMPKPSNPQGSME